MSFEIVTDSCANLTDETIAKYGIHIVPLYYIVNGEERLSYVKGKKTDLKPYYDLMRNNVPLSTSSSCRAICENIFNEVLKSGKDLLFIGIASTLSATYEVVSHLLNDLRSQYPKQKIYHIDSMCASLGQGLLVIQAAQMRDNGADITTTYDWVQDNKRNVCHVIAIDSPTYLYRGGRLKKSQYFLASTLNIKPILYLDSSGNIAVSHKVFGRKNSLSSLAKHVAETISNPSEQTIYVGHADSQADAEYFISLLKEKIKFKNAEINIFDPVMGAHSGPGTIAVFYMANSR